MRSDDDSENIRMYPAAAELAEGGPGEDRIPDLVGDHLAGRFGRAGDQPAASGEGGGEDPVHHPTHYTSSAASCSACGHPIECIDIVEHMEFCLGNAVKYIWRCDLKKDAIEDLKKAAWYIEREIARRSGNV